MEWVINNWFLLVFVALCLGMHFLGHRGHGRHEETEGPEHKGHAHAGTLKSNDAKKGQMRCH